MTLTWYPAASRVFTSRFTRLSKMKLPSSMKMRTLPADATVSRPPGDVLAIRSGRELPLEETREIEDGLVRPELVLLEGPKLLRAVPDDDELRALEQGFERRGHEARDVRNLAQDVGLVGADQPVEVDERIVDLELVALSDQPLRERDERALAQVIRPRLEAESEEPDLPGAELAHDLHGLVDVGVVRWDDGAEERYGDVRLPRLVCEGPQVLGEAGSAEGEAGLHVGARDVELRVLAQEVHDDVAVRAQPARDPADLVREGDLERVERVRGVLEHLGDAKRDHV